MSGHVELAAGAERGFALILEHLIESHGSFGDGPAEARERARQRLLAILDESQRIAIAPHRDSRHDQMLPGLRQLTLGKATFWSTAEDAARRIRILAVFFGAQNQERRMLIRLLEASHDH